MAAAFSHLRTGNTAGAGADREIIIRVDPDIDIVSRIDILGIDVRLL